MNGFLNMLDLLTFSTTPHLVFTCRTPEEMTKHFEQQAQIQKEQLDMIHAQQESIDTLKQMLSQLIEDKIEAEGQYSFQEL